MTKVSIIIPAYQQAHYLAQAIESGLGQTHPDVEVIVVDDGSPDETHAVAARYLDRPNFRYVRQDNTGLPGARNRGLKESTGEYLCFLDADDWYQPEKVARQVALLDANPAVGWVYCDVISVDAQGQPLAEQYSVAQARRLLSGNLFGSLLQSGYFQPHTVMIRRTVLDQIGMFDPALGGYADYDLWLRAAGAGFDAVFMPERLAVYRVHANSMSRNGQHMNETRLGAFRNAVRLFPERVALGLNQLQQTVIDFSVAPRSWRQQVSYDQCGQGAKAVAAPAEPTDSSDVQLTILWRSKLEAGVALAGLQQRTAAARMMLEAVKSVEKCHRPRVILEALIEVPDHLKHLDPGRALFLLNMGVKFATKLGDQAALERAAAVVASFPTATPAGRT